MCLLCGDGISEQRAGDLTKMVCIPAAPDLKLALASVDSLRVKLTLCFQNGVGAPGDGGSAIDDLYLFANQPFATPAPAPE